MTYTVELDHMYVLNKLRTRGYASNRTHANMSSEDEQVRNPGTVEKRIANSDGQTDGIDG